MFIKLSTTTKTLAKMYSIIYKHNKRPNDGTMIIPGIAVEAREYH